MNGYSRDIQGIVERALAEDIGQGDWTTVSIVPDDLQGRARIVAKAPAVVAGLAWLDAVWDRFDDEVSVLHVLSDGDRAAPGDVVARIEGPYRALLTGERVALNLLQRASGIATATRAFVDAVEGCGARVVDTRKTVPGLRALDKYAVRVGGGASHRSGLDGGVLIKENHIAAAGGIREAVARARARAPMTLRVEVETQTLADVREALDAGADIIMLDNMDNASMREAVGVIGGRAIVEASGNVDLVRVRAIAETGVDVISVGALTHSVRAADLSMLIEPVLIEPVLTEPTQVG